MASFVERCGSDFQSTWRTCCELQAACCAITFGSHVLRSIDYQTAAFPDPAEQVLQGSLIYQKLNMRNSTYSYLIFLHIWFKSHSAQCTRKAEWSRKFNIQLNYFVRFPVEEILDSHSPACTEGIHCSHRPKFTKLTWHLT